MVHWKMQKLKCQNHLFLFFILVSDIHSKFYEKKYLSIFIFGPYSFFLYERRES